MPTNKPILICVVGPTAIGKTTLAIAIAKAFSTEIISADSRQFYKEMTVGTAVPSTSELAEIKHHFIQNKSIFTNYSVGDFEKEALALLDQLFVKHPIVVMVGGSGLYVDAVVKGLDVFPDVNPKIREQLNFELESSGIEVLQKELKEVDPAYFEKTDIHNPRRVIRALEIFRSSKKPYTSFLRKEENQRNFDPLYIGLTAEREQIYDRINRRVDIMIANGLIEEAKSLFSDKELNALQTVGYRELFQHFEGNLSKEQAVEEIKKNSRRFAKRQGTWFRKNNSINWFDTADSFSEILSFIKQKTP
ncbi:MAG: tRNA (adenosine(37)-N6)-dimethylallyltransferase MiaA [Flavobacteriaceae bacterium]|nr:tRNA (adenosine(37)-N6)-dimethylallyltransferase MiaA [Flavobacteriaceae bacterium]